MSRTGPQLAVDTCARRLRGLDAPGAGPWPEPEISWYGPAAFGPDRPGSEATIQALCGLMEVNGRDRRTPRRLGLEVASVAAGILAAQGALAGAIGALRGRPPAAVGTSVLQAGLLLLSHYFVVATGLGDAVPGPPLAAPGPPFRSADGQWFEIETLDAEPWMDFWTALGAGDADLGRGWTVFRWRYERAACSLPVGLHEATARLPLDELRRLAERADVSLTPLRDYTDVVVDPGVGPAHPTVRASPVATPTTRAPAALSCGDLPLAGIRVVEATSRIQGPFAGMLLRMLGAEVLRIQPPEGDYGRAALCLHRGKAAVRLDLGTVAGRTELAGLVADADVFVHNWRPGKAAQWRLEFGDLAAGHPGLVYANTSGWGDRPEARRLVGTDFLVQAYAGTGQGLHPDGEPPFPSRVILCDLFGGLVGAEGVLTGLYRRERHGEACEVRSSLLAGATALQAHVLDDIAAGREKGRRDGRPSWGVLDRPVRTAEGMLMVSTDDDEDFRRLCRACDVDPEVGPRAVTEPAVAARLGDDRASHWEDRLEDEGVAAATVCEDLASVPADPRLSGLFEPVGIGGVAPLAPWAFT
ncbi:MAG TPA: CoA transferase [Acidimicrobiales bacterium]|nr:CoA transferase [Acidimicrobiales bacterium]